jgi:hypothetical protein
MKAMKAIIISVLIFIGFVAGAQVEEGSSGVQTFKISKKKSPSTEQNNTQKVDEGASEKELFLITKKDEEAPQVKIISPIAQEGQAIVVANMKVMLTGLVKDESGILTVLVNNAEAVVSADGKFQAEVLLAYGINEIQIKAIDIHKNIRVKTIAIERKAGDIKVDPKIEVSPTTNKKDASILVNWKMDGSSPYSTTVEDFMLDACISASGEIVDVLVYNNNRLISKVSKKDVKFRGDCDYSLKHNVVLTEGSNRIRLIVKTALGSQEKQIEVNYSPSNARYYALIIGVDDYKDNDIKDLDNPVKDATRLKTILKTNYTFEEEDIIFLANPTKADIIGTLHGLRKKLTENDNLLIFYAGHGYWDEDMKLGYWLPSDANNDNPVNWIPNTDLTNYLSAIKTKHTLLIADACFSGGIFKTRKAFTNQVALEKLMQLKSRKAITSGTLTEVPDRSVFIQYLTKRLSENQNKYLSSEQLFSNMRLAVLNNSDNIPQYGTIHNTGDEGGDFIFIHR